MKKFFILTYPRVGSYVLCEVLQRFGCGNPKGFFYGDYSQEFHRYKEFKQNEIIKTGLYNDIFGCKVHFWDILENKGNHIDVFNKLIDTDNTYFITLERRDKVKQAVSFYIAHKLNKYVHYTIDNNLHQDNIEYSFDGIYKYYKYFQDKESEWKEWLKENNKEYLELVYEEDIKIDPFKGAKKIMDYIHYDYKDIEINKELENKIAFPEVRKLLYKKFSIDLKKYV